MYLKLHVTPRSKQEAVTRVGADKFLIKVKERAAGNPANKRAIQVLAGHLGIDSSNLRIVSGHQSPHKIILIRP